MKRFAGGYQKLLDWVPVFRHPFLLVVRLIWGLQFMITGWGKLGNLEGVTSYFTNLGIPAPGFNAVLVSCTELVGGAAMLVGFASRLTMIPLIITMKVAYLTSDLEAVTSSTLLNPDPIVEAAPFAFLMAASMVWIFGPGLFSFDALIGRWWRSRR